jgi:hypothetical protein
MSRIYIDFAQGTLDAAPSVGATSLDSPEFADLPAIAAPDHLFITLDPQGGTPEKVRITAHATGSNTVTCEPITGNYAVPPEWVAGLYATDFGAPGSLFVESITDHVMNPMPTVDTVINGTTVTIPASGTDRRAMVQFYVRHSNSAAGRRVGLRLDTTVLTALSYHRTIPQDDSLSAGWYLFLGMSAIIPGDGASHTLSIVANAMSNTNATTWYRRWMRVQLEAV